MTASPYGQHFIISGKVQGVWYSKFAAEKAQKLGLTGWVRNLKSGDVELEAYGGEEPLGRLLN